MAAKRSIPRPTPALRAFNRAKLALPSEGI